MSSARRFTAPVYALKPEGEGGSLAPVFDGYPVIVLFASGSSVSGSMHVKDEMHKPPSRGG